MPKLGSSLNMLLYLWVKVKHDSFCNRPFLYPSHPNHLTQPLRRPVCLYPSVRLLLIPNSLCRSFEGKSEGRSGQVVNSPSFGTYRSGTTCRSNFQIAWNVD